MGPFKRSWWFGIIGVLVVMAAVAVVGLQSDPRDANPKDTLAVIFGIVGAYMVVLFFLQGRDLSRAELADNEALELRPESIENPALLEEPKLWAAMAVRPIDRDAIRARRDMWGVARGSWRLAMLVTALIFLAVPPIYLFDTFVPLLIGAPLIVLIALWKSVRLLMSGGDFDKAYDLADRAMAPLGLGSTERPDLRIEPKSVAPFRMGPALHGALVLEGERHGRRVRVTMPAGGVRTVCRVELGADTPEFDFRTRDGRLKAEKGAPAAMAELLKSVPNSTRWNGVRGEGGRGVIAIERKGAASGDWLLDLWLAERLAAAAGGPR